MPITRTNNKPRTKGRRRIVIGGANWKITIKNAKTISSIISVIEAVIPALIAGTDLGK